MTHAQAVIADVSWQKLIDHSAAMEIESVFRRTLNLRAELDNELYTMFLCEGYEAPRAASISLTEKQIDV